MTTRGRSFGQGHDWDPMRDDFDNTKFNPQYPDEDASNLVELDQCRLYIRSIPFSLNEEGLRSAFSHFGNIVELFFSQDPSKRFGLISFETAGEAKHAMMKLNETGPLNLKITLAHKNKKGDQNRRTGKERRERNDNTEARGPRERGSNSDDFSSKRERGAMDRDDASTGSRNWNSRRQEEMANGDGDELVGEIEDNLTLDELQAELDRMKLEEVKLKQIQLQYEQRMLINEANKRALVHSITGGSRCVTGRKVTVHNTVDGGAERDAEGSYAAGAGDSNDRESVCSCKVKQTWDRPGCSSDDAGSSTPSTCVLCSEGRSERHSDSQDYQDKSDVVSNYQKSKKRVDYPKLTDTKTADVTSRKSETSKTTDSTSKKSDHSKFTDISKTEVTSKKSELTNKKYLAKNKSETTVDLKYSDFYYTDSEDEPDETNRLIQLRHSDYMDIVPDELKIVIGLAGYPKSKMRLRQMELFQRCLTDVMEMQLRAGLLKKSPSFLDYYLNRGAVVCICKDLDTRNWMVRVSPGLQERMSNNLVLLKAKVKRLCLAVLKIPHSCWPESAHDAFKLLQYFNPTLKTELWRIYAQKTVDNIECTSFLIDRVSGEFIRGPTFKNVIDYNQMEFELTGYTEIYHESLLSDLEEDICSVSSRVKLLQKIKSEDTTPRNISTNSLQKQKSPVVPQLQKEKVKKKLEEEGENKINVTMLEQKTEFSDMKTELESNLQKDVLTKLNDVKYITEKDEVIIWSDEVNYNSDHENERSDQINDEDIHKIIEIIEERKNVAATSGVAVSEKTDSIIESSDNLTLSRNCNLNIDSNRGIAYHRRTNYLHVENEMKIAITLEDYPKNKLEGTHIRRLKHLFKEYLHKDMKNQRFANLIVPKFQDIYLSNGAVIYICDSLETKDYLTDVLPKFVHSTGLKLTFRGIKDLVRYTRIIMRLPKEHAHVESSEILLKLQTRYPNLKPDCWKYYSDVAGKQKRQFGVDPESLDIIRSPDFDSTYEGDKIYFRVIDRQKRDLSFEEPSTTDMDAEEIENEESKALLENVLRNMYSPIDPDIMNVPLTRIRTNHYSDLIADDLKLYVGPSNYPESRIDDGVFHSIKRTFESMVFDSLKDDIITEETIPKFYDMYLFDGVIFIICQNMLSRRWVEQTLSMVNSKLRIHLKATEFRGAVGIISMVVKTEKSTDEVIKILQNQNPRLRTKFWRKISTVRTKTKLDVVLQIDKLSAQVITSRNFKKFIGPNTVQFKLGHLQSLLKPKASLEELSKKHASKTKKINKRIAELKSKSKVQMQLPKDITFEELKTDLKKEYPGLRIDDWNVIEQHEKANRKVCELEIDEDSAKIIEKEDFKLSMGDEKVFFYTHICHERSNMEPEIEEPESPRSIDTSIVLPVENNNTDLRKMILKIPINVLPENKDDLSIIFDLLEDKNPGLNTELWQVFTDSPYPNNGRFTLVMDKQSATVIQGKKFDPTIGGEKLKFFF